MFSTAFTVSLGIYSRCEQPGWFNFPVTLIVAGEGRRWDDEELRWYEIEFGGQRKEAGVEGRFDFSLFEGFAVVEVGVGEDAA